MSSDLERLAAACLLPAFPGLTPPDWIRRWLADGLGGVVLFSHNVSAREQVAELTAALRAERPELLVAIDEEGGDVTRLEAERGSSYPGNWALGAVDDVRLTAAVARSLAGQLAELGITLDFAPVADVATNADNPVIGIRSFGPDPEAVARHVAAFVEGMQSAGVAACAKHFPGHGATSEDSHLELPSLDKDREALLAEDLPPFQAAIEAGVRAIMTAHIRVPAVDDVPATLSRMFLTELLRGELAFEGLIVTDALEMRAVSATVGVEEGAVLALAAGADALCLGHDLRPEEIRSAIAEAVRDGRLAEQRLAEAANRVAAAGRWAAEAKRDSGAVTDVGLAAARRALRVEGSVELARPPLVVELRPEPSIAAGPAGFGLGAALRARLPSADVLHVDGARPVSVPAHRQLVLVLRDGHRHPWQRELAETLLTGGRDAIAVETGLPVWRPPGAAGYVATHGAGRVNLEAAAEVLVPR